MSTAVYHTIRLEGAHGNSDYVLTIWNRDNMDRALRENTTDALSPLFEETVNLSYQPRFILFPCPPNLYINFTEVEGTTILGRVDSHTYRLEANQETVELVFQRNAFSSQITDNGAQRVVRNLFEIPAR